MFLILNFWDFLEISTVRSTEETFWMLRLLGVEPRFDYKKSINILLTNFLFPIALLVGDSLSLSSDVKWLLATEQPLTTILSNDYCLIPTGTPKDLLMGLGNRLDFVCLVGDSF